MNVIILSIISLVVSLFVPIGGAILFSITFAVVILNYQKTLKVHEDIKEIKRHFDLMKKDEKEEYEIEKQLEEYDNLDSSSLEEINRKIEEELDKPGEEEKKKEDR